MWWRPLVNPPSGGGKLFDDRIGAHSCCTMLRSTTICWRSLLSMVVWGPILHRLALAKRNMSMFYSAARAQLWRLERLRAGRNIVDQMCHCKPSMRTCIFDGSSVSLSADPLPLHRPHLPDYDYCRIRDGFRAPWFQGECGDLSSDSVVAFWLAFWSCRWVCRPSKVGLVSMFWASTTPVVGRCVANVAASSGD